MGERFKMEGWVVTLIISAGTIVGTFAVTKYIVGELKNNQSAIFERLEKHGDAIVALNTKVQSAITAKDVDDKFVSKELFRQFEKHIDSRFDEVKDSFKQLNDGQNQILEYLRQRG